MHRPHARSGPRPCGTPTPPGPRAASSSRRILPTHRRAADSVRYVFLSATIPNAREFAEWVANTHRQPVNVVYTDYRPTPLEHYLFPAGDSNIYLVVDKECARRPPRPAAAPPVIRGSLRGERVPRLLFFHV